MRRAPALLPSLLFVLAASACTRPPEAPEDLVTLSRFLYAHWGDEDPRTMSAGLRNLRDFLADQDLTAGLQERSWELDDLQPEDVADIDRPEDRDLADCLGSGVAHESPWPVTDHARAQTLEDQRPFEPTAPDNYVREFPELDDSACFTDRDCDELITVNDVTRQNILLTADFILFKDMRWVDLSEELDGSGPWAVSARSWLAESWPGRKERVWLYQSYSIDVWIEADGRTWRYQTLWSETDPGFEATDGQILGSVKVGTDGIFRAGDQGISDVFHEGRSAEEVYGER